MALASAITSLILLVGALLNSRLGPSYTLPRLGWAILAGFASIALLYRYLKFYRHYTLQVFVLYGGMS